MSSGLCSVLLIYLSICQCYTVSITVVLLLWMSLLHLLISSRISLSQFQIFCIDDHVICEQRQFCFSFSNSYPFYYLFLSHCISCDGQDNIDKELWDGTFLPGINREQNVGHSTTPMIYILFMVSLMIASIIITCFNIFWVLSTVIKTWQLPPLRDLGIHDGVKRDSRNSQQARKKFVMNHQNERCWL